MSLQNLAPSKGQSPLVIGSEAQKISNPGENDCYLTIYTPWLFTRATVNGRPLLLNSTRELGAWADSAFVSIPPGGTTTITLSLTGSLRAGSSYRLTMSRQPTVAPDQVFLHVRLPAGEHFSDTSPGLVLATKGQALSTHFVFESNRSISAAVK